MSCLVYFTSSFPYGIGEEWKYNDLEALVKRFENVVVIPLTYGGKSSPSSDVPVGATVSTPLFENESDISAISVASVAHGVTRDSMFRRELFAGLKYCQLRHLRAIATSYLRGVAIAAEIQRKIDSLPYDPSTISAFFFWGLGAAEGIPWLDLGFRRVVVGYHGYDLYEERRGHLPFPFRRGQLARIDLAVPCSADGVAALKNSNPEFATKVKKRTLGTRDIGLSPWQYSTTLRLVSCSFISKVKRLDLLIAGLSLCRSEIHWTHIGGGPDLEILISLAEKCLARTHVKYEFVGTVSPSEVREFYSTNQIDALVSTSAMEGLPVSMMEAISAGIPLIGTDVGGVREIIDPAVGALMSPNPKPIEIATTIDQVAQLSSCEMSLKRQSARNKFLREFQVPDVTNAFIEVAFPNLPSCKVDANE